MSMLEVDKTAFDGESSALLRAVISSLPSDIILARDNLEHQRFLVCLTYHMTHWKKIAMTLSMELRNRIESIEYNQQNKLHEEAFEMVVQWISASPNESSLNNLLHALKQNNHKIKVVSRTEENRIHNLLGSVGKRALEYNFMYKVAIKISVAWTTLGRLLGMPGMDITCTLDDHRTEGAIEQAFQMLISWYKHAESANYAAFAKALALLLVLDPAKARDTWDFTLSHMSSLAYDTYTIP